MEEYFDKNGKQLRNGYTTGSCAAAAAKAAAFMLFTGGRKERISLKTPAGVVLTLPVSDVERNETSVRCSVQKDSGDDPDVTDGIRIFAEVSFLPAEAGGEEGKIAIAGGEGIGVVTKPGLDQPVGEAAINSVPRKMIAENVLEVCRLMDYNGSLKVTVSAPEGKKLAEKTFNPRLGIVGGISILGTTGIVEPMSERALVETIRAELRVRKAGGAEYVLLTPGNYGAAFIRDTLHLDPSEAVMTSNFIGDSLEICAELGFKGALLVGHIGKLVKLAGGMMNTHSRYGDCRMEILAAHAAAAGLPAARAAEVLSCVSTEEAVRILTDEGVLRQTMAGIADRIAVHMARCFSGDMSTGAIVFTKQHGLLCGTEGAAALLEQIRAGAEEGN